MAVRYFPAARKDIKSALKWSVENFGEAASRRYKTLIGVVIAEIDADPELTHSYEIPGLQENIRLYHLKHSRTRAAVDGQMVKKPRHFVAYMAADGDTMIVRILHERMQITQLLKDTL